MKKTISLRLVASDLGGTLVPPGEKNVPPASLSVLESILTRGVPVALVTGFNFHTARRMIAGLKGTPWLLVQNGTTALLGDQIIWEYDLAPHDAERLVRTLESLKVPVVAYRNLSRGGVPEYRGFDLFRRGFPFRSVQSFSDFSGITGVSTCVKNHKVGEVKAALNKDLSQGLRMVLSRGRSSTWVEVTPLNASKVRALRRLCKELKVDPEQVIYFGDNLNDLETLRMVGFPRVVEDALPELREEFPNTGSSQDQGPARELARLFGLSTPFGPSAKRA